jgi:hypothetical protein
MSAISQRRRHQRIAENGETAAAGVSHHRNIEKHHIGGGSMKISAAKENENNDYLHQSKAESHINNGVTAALGGSKGGIGEAASSIGRNGWRNSAHRRKYGVAKMEIENVVSAAISYWHRNENKAALSEMKEIVMKIENRGEENISIVMAKAKKIMRKLAAAA